MREGWKNVPLSELASFHSGGTPNKGRETYWGGPIPWVTVKDMKVMRLNGVGESLTKAGADTVRVVPAGTVLVLVRGMGLFKDLPVVLCNRPVTFNQDIKALVAKKGVDSEYLAFALIARKSDILRHVDSAGHGTGRLDTDLLKSTPLPLPPLPEQRKIAEILRTWDEAIEKLTALRTAKEKRLHSLREKLTYFDAQGEPVRLGDVSEEVTKRNGGGLLGREMVMGVTNSRGIVPMREQTIAEDISRYKVVPPQAFAYNPMRINVGSIAMNEAEEPILVSPDYVVFACLQGRLSPDFLDHLRNTKWWSHYINSGGSGSVRQRTYYADLAAMKVPLPNFERQCRIADVLNTGRRDVEMTTIEIDALTRQKRGLMQKLLTGEWRVTVDPTTPFNPAEETHDGR
jgi:type I restriction enzyme, S subunit